jgi:CheY-like chemotaxis protein
VSLSEPVDVAALLGRIAEIVRQVTGARSVILWQVQPPGNLLVRRAWSTDPSLCGASLPDRRAFGEGAAGWIAEHREPLFVPDIAGDARSLLLFAREGGQEQRAVDLADALEKVLALRATQLRLSNIRVERDHAPDLPRVLGDVNQLQQVFLNLLLNAEQVIAESGSGGCIRLRTATRADARGRWVLGQISDDGPGIRSDVLPRIFEPFFTTKEVGSGTGLGLSVSYGIVQEHGGRIEVESRPGATTFSVVLPVAAEAPLSTSTSAHASTPRRPGVDDRRALVVDDEPAVVQLIVALLREEQWHVDEAENSQAGLARARVERYDLIVSDVRMADGSGEDFYRAVVAERPEVAARFLFVTGDTANPTVLRFLTQARVPVLAKPFGAEAFYQAVDALTARR